MHFVYLYMHNLVTICWQPIPIINYRSTYYGQSHSFFGILISVFLVLPNKTFFMDS